MYIYIYVFFPTKCPQTENKPTHTQAFVISVNIFNMYILFFKKTKQIKAKKKTKNEDLMAPPPPSVSVLQDFPARKNRVNPTSGVRKKMKLVQQATWNLAVL